ncbi:MAG TPA: TonB-dependent receptor, partial [Holophagaceae bacterium]|nr:TonB-dependent receptor [Holophagaceae bacterium]
PDQPESMKEERRIAVLKYAKESGGLTQEYALRYQWHGIDWNQRYYPDGTDFGAPYTYPNGLSEYLNTSADELFGRAQLTWQWGKDASLVAGFEANRFTYGGDRGHTSNVDLNYGSPTVYEPVPGGAVIPLRPFLEWTVDRPVLRTALYAQYASGKILDGHLSVTAGLRYDKQQSDFNALDRGPVGGPYPTEKLSYSQASPRLGLIYHASNNYSLKLLVGRAFRTPAPSETFGANTYALASNLRSLQPEIADTVELASDWIINRNLDWRINVYEAKLKNLIAYSPSLANLSANLYTLKTRGVETELLWGTGHWNGFINASKSQRVSETVEDPLISPSTEVTWIPSLTANAGATFKVAPWSVGVTLHYQGEAKRRDSDLGYAPLRPDTVAAFTGASLRVGWRPTKAVELELGATNAFDTKGYYAKNIANPFDYRVDPRTIWFGIRIN